MVKKHSIEKPQKKIKTSEPSSSRAIDPKDDPARYWKMNFIAERGFKTEKAPDVFTSTVIALGWQKFIKHRGEYVVPLVREFYQGIPPPKGGKPQTYSLVRGETVDFSPSSINDYFKLGYSGKALDKKLDTWGCEEMEEVKRRICVEEATWERFGSEFKVKKAFLVDEAAMWFTFIRHSLMPTSHTTNVEKDRLIVLDAILEGESIDVGKIIAREIEKSRLKTDDNLYFPCLITELCKQAEVEIEIRDERRTPQGDIPAVFKPRQRSASAIASDAIALNQLKKNQQVLCKFVKAKFEWEKAVLEKLSRGKELMEPPVFPEWLIEDEGVKEPPQAKEKVSKKAAADPSKKRARSPATRKSPAKKKAKVSSEESLNTEDLEELSEDDEEETRRVMREVNDSEEEEDSESEEKSGEESPEKEKESESEEDEEVSADPNPSPTRPPSPQIPSPQAQEQIIPETPQSEPTIPPPEPEKEKSPSPAKAPNLNEPPQPDPSVQSPIPTKEQSPPPASPQQSVFKNPAEGHSSAIASDAIAPEPQSIPVSSVSSATKTPRLKQKAQRSPQSKTNIIAGSEEEAQAMAESPPREVAQGPVPSGTPSRKLKEKHVAAKRPTYVSARRSPGAKLTVIEEVDEERVQQAAQQSGKEVSEQEKEAATKLAEMRAEKEKEAPGGSAIASEAIASKEEQKEAKKKKKAVKPPQPSRVSSRTRSGLVKK